MLILSLVFDIRRYHIKSWWLIVELIRTRLSRTNTALGEDLIMSLVLFYRIHFGCTEYMQFPLLKGELLKLETGLKLKNSVLSKENQMNRWLEMFLSTQNWLCLFNSKTFNTRHSTPPLTIHNRRIHAGSCISAGRNLIYVDYSWASIVVKPGLYLDRLESLQYQLSIFNSPAVPSSIPFDLLELSTCIVSIGCHAWL